MKVKGGLIIGGIFLLGFILVILIQGAKFHLNPMSEYQILTPIKQVKKGEIDQTVRPFFGQSFWRINLDQIQANIVKIDWVHSVQVKRQWPNKILLSIEEQNPVARWGETALLNDYGDIFYPHNIKNYQNLVQLKGMDQRAKLILSRLAIYQKQFNRLGWHVKSLSEAVNGVWEIHFMKAPTVILNEKKWSEKLGRFIRAYHKVKLTVRKSASKIDLRYSNGFVIQEQSKG